VFTCSCMVSMLDWTVVPKFAAQRCFLLVSLSCYTKCLLATQARVQVPSSYTKTTATEGGDLPPQSVYLQSNKLLLLRERMITSISTPELTCPLHSVTCHPALLATAGPPQSAYTVHLSHSACFCVGRMLRPIR
jgi:hypothetical protein